LGEHNVYNALCAASVGLVFGLKQEQIKSGLLNFEGAKKKTNIFIEQDIIL
jgi:UDP-N-acetylmuramyl pentapeptide synthase